jgi:hypothetical protein
MKKQIIAFLIFGISISGFSQKISEDFTDEFTKKKIIRTDWNKISSSKDLYLKVRISKVNEISFLELKFFVQRIASIDITDEISFMFEDGEVVNLKSTEYKLSNYGDGATGLLGSEALGFHIQCLLSEIEITKFKTKIVKKIRINKSTGYSQNELKIKDSQKLKQMFDLIYKQNNP